MSLLRVVQRGAVARPARLAASSLVRMESTSTPQTGVDVAQQQPSEITTIPPKEAVPADIVSGAPGAFPSSYPDILMAD